MREAVLSAFLASATRSVSEAERWAPSKHLANEPRSLYLTLICAVAIALQGCIQHSSVEQRVAFELPDGNPNTSLAIGSTNR